MCEEQNYGYNYANNNYYYEVNIFNILQLLLYTYIKARANNLILYESKFDFLIHTKIKLFPGHDLHRKIFLKLTNSCCFLMLKN